MTGIENRHFSFVPESPLFDKACELPNIETVKCLRLTNPIASPCCAQVR